MYLLFLNFGLNFVISHTIATAIAIINKYFLTKNFTFKKRQTNLSSFLKFLIVSFIQYVVSIFIIYIFVSWGFSEQIAYFPSVFVGIAVSYLGNRFWSFRK
ncbi:MAG: GtrA family protein [Defluviitaleaceae bacterium]|nr:GtrA family protein [Defluviitaleaceae bacterium]